MSANSAFSHPVCPSLMSILRLLRCMPWWAAAHFVLLVFFARTSSCELLRDQSSAGNVGYPLNRVQYWLEAKAISALQALSKKRIFFRSLFCARLKVQHRLPCLRRIGAKWKDINDPKGMKKLFWSRQIAWQGSEETLHSACVWWNKNEAWQSRWKVVAMAVRSPTQTWVVKWFVR